MFEIGDYVIYRRDLCIIKDIIDNKYYKLSLVDDNTLSISVPIDNKFGLLRKPMTKAEAEELINKIPNIEPLKTNDKLLENAYKELMRTNKQEDLIKIIKTTYLRNKEREETGKKIADKDQTFFEQAEKYLYNELALSLNMNYEECKKYIIESVTQEINNQKEKSQNKN